MATVIEIPGSTRWDEAFPEILTNGECNRALNTALLLIAAWKSRGNVKSNPHALNKILDAYVSDLLSLDKMEEPELAELGRVTYYLVKAIKLNPQVYRT